MAKHEKHEKGQFGNEKQGQDKHSGHEKHGHNKHGQEKHGDHKHNDQKHNQNQPKWQEKQGKHNGFGKTSHETKVGSEEAQESSKSHKY